MLLWSKYQTPSQFTDILMSSDGTCLTGLWFEGSRDAVRKHILPDEAGQNDTLPVFLETTRWLDEYFSGRQPSFTPQLLVKNLTAFRKEVIDEMMTIPFGETKTYGEIAQHIALRHGIRRMSARAVGTAVGWNPICIIIPCHRVIGSDGSLTGYGGGIENKRALLALEQSTIYKQS